MTLMTRANWRFRLLFSCSAALAAAAIAAVTPAKAQVWAGYGYPYQGYYQAPAPYWGYPAPYAYAPPGYAYPPSGYMERDDAPPTAPAPSAYAPRGNEPAAASIETQPIEPEPARRPAEAAAPAAPDSDTPHQARITYTKKPAFTNAAGQTCRQYKTTDTSDGRKVEAFGTACRQADGQWRVVD
jgi:hypothetical protein